MKILIYCLKLSLGKLLILEELKEAHQLCFKTSIQSVLYIERNHIIYLNFSITSINNIYFIHLFWVILSTICSQLETKCILLHLSWKYQTSLGNYFVRKSPGFKGSLFFFSNKFFKLISENTVEYKQLLNILNLITGLNLFFSPLFLFSLGSHFNFFYFPFVFRQLNCW